MSYAMILQQLLDAIRSKTLHFVIGLEKFRAQRASVLGSFGSCYR